MTFYMPYYPVTLLLVVSRFAALVGMTSMFGRNMIPIRIRMMIALALSWFAAVRVPLVWREYCYQLDTLSEVAIAMLGELLMGVALGLVCDMFFGILNLTGLIVGRASSLMMAQMVDPTTGGNDGIISSLFTMLFALLVLLWDGHLFLVKLMVESFQIIPPGFSWFRQEYLEMFTVLGSDLFAWGVRFALPVMIGGMLVVVAMGLMSKMAPEFNVLFLSLPVRLAMGLGMLVIFFLYGHDVFFKVFEGMLEHMQYILKGGA